MSTHTTSVEDSLYRAREVMMRSSMEEHQQVFSHHGPVGAEMVHQLLGVAEQCSLSIGDPITLRKRLFNVLVEGLENIHRHAEGAFSTTAGVALFIKEDGYTMLLGNGMPIIKATMLEHRLELLNEMAATDLKDHYMRLLAHEGRTANGGAGLGLMTMARKSTRPMLFRTTAVNEHTVYGLLELRIARQ